MHKRKHTSHCLSAERGKEILDWLRPAGYSILYEMYSYTTRARLWLGSVSRDNLFFWPCQQNNIIGETP